MRRLFHSVTLSPTDVTFFLPSFSLSSDRPFALYGGRADANKTVDEVSRPISGKAGGLFLVCE